MRVPKREIGFGENKEPIVLGPVGHNFGFTVDTKDPWPESDPESAEAATRFQQVRDDLWPKFKHLEQ